MRKVIESTLVSVDGVIGYPHEWTGEHFGEEAVTRALDQLTRSDAMVMGRTTYEMFSNIWSEPVDDYSADPQVRLLVDPGTRRLEQHDRRQR